MRPRRLPARRSTAPAGPARGELQAGDGVERDRVGLDDAPHVADDVAAAEGRQPPPQALAQTGGTSPGRIRPQMTMAVACELS